MSNKMYGVLSLEGSHELEWAGFTIELNLNWADGMIGVIPVFDTEEAALKYMDGDTSKIFVLEEKDKNENTRRSN